MKYGESDKLLLNLLQQFVKKQKPSKFMLKRYAIFKRPTNLEGFVIKLGLS